MKTEPLTYDGFFQIYTRGNIREDLFRDPENREYFLALYDKYVSPVAETYAWVLMPNHFYLLVRIKDEDEIGFIPYQPKPLLESSIAKRIVDGSCPSELAYPEGG